MYKKYYQAFLTAQENILHFAAHSHHYWPDITREAQLRYWDDSAKYVDSKWEVFFSDRLPRLSESISRALGFRGGDRWVYAPNTHELVFRILSSFHQNKYKILTTDSEFHSFRRQIEILENNGKCEVTYVEALPSESFSERFIQRFRQDSYDVVFFSSCFFNSGIRSEVSLILAELVSSKAVIIVDGYHSFFAYPMDFVSSFQERVFFIGGSYKYAQGGEGLCYAWVPSWFDSQNLLPENSGWFAEIERIDNDKGKDREIFYPKGASVLGGSTIDLSGAYRLQAVLDLFHSEELTVSLIDQSIQKLMACFLAKVDLESLADFPESGLTESHLGLDRRGHFLAFTFKDELTVSLLKKDLVSRGLVVDSRGNKLRIGFGMYHDKMDSEQAANIFNQALKSVAMES